MSQPDISVYNNSGGSVPVEESMVARMAEELSKGESVMFQFIEVVFVTEDEIIRINQEHLQRDYITDIITFHYHEKGEAIEGSLFCCAPRINEQAAEFEMAPSTEFARVVLHGLLHLCGYEDSNPSLKKNMTEKENTYLTQLRYL